MIALGASVGWGLLAFGAATHVFHQRRFRTLLAMHLDHERLPAALVTALEVGLALALPIGFLGDRSWLLWVTATAALVGLVFVGWIGRLLGSGSSLPCACSFSQAPTSVWSLARACLVLTVALFWFAPTDPEFSVNVATLVTGLAIAGAVFVLPEALAWPSASRAVLTRVRAHQAA